MLKRGHDNVARARINQNCERRADFLTSPASSRQDPIDTVNDPVRDFNPRDHRTICEPGCYP